CIANALLLIKRARTVFVSKLCVPLNALSPKPNRFPDTNHDKIFILARILFLATVSSSPFIATLVEEKRQGRLTIDDIS
ncbi:hypothetical protein B0H11DRAFT_1666426, partial [Mycena galericulata]